ncbi:MAG: radical SAM protein, partial [Nitrospiraceae bacterium]|nr:radical SAM protein [Nitrospiraceae bacterium]
MSQNKKINAMINITFPTSIGVMAGYLRSSAGVTADIIDEQINAIGDADLPGMITSLSMPRIIGISVLTLNCGRAYELAEKIKQVDPAATVVLGGIHPTVVPEEVLGRKGVDVVVRGEGEETFRELVQCVLEGRGFHHIRGISYSREGAAVHNPDRPLIENLDVIPPFPYYLFEKDLHRYPNFSGIFGSRGCPYQCSFCSSRSISGRKYRYHSVERVIAEIKVLVRKYHQPSVFLMDDNIAVNKRHFKELCDAIISEGLHKEVFFHGSLRGDNASDDVLDMARQANFRILYYGLETGNEELMRIINKGETVAVVEDAIRRTSAKGFSVGTTIIFGLPTETRKDRYDTMRFVRRLPLSSVRFNTLTPYPGTPVFAQESAKGNILIKGNWENFGVQYMWESDDIPYVPEGNDRVELIFDTMWANLSYYLSFSGLKKLFTSRYAGGNVIKLKTRWYLSPAELKKMVDLFLYLFSRFSSVAARTF